VSESDLRLRFWTAMLGHAFLFVGLSGLLQSFSTAAAVVTGLFGAELIVLAIFAR